MDLEPTTLGGPRCDALRRCRTGTRALAVASYAEAGGQMEVRPGTVTGRSSPHRGFRFCGAESRSRWAANRLYDVRTRRERGVQGSMNHAVRSTRGIGVPMDATIGVPRKRPTEEKGADMRSARRTLGVVAVMSLLAVAGIVSGASVASARAASHESYSQRRLKCTVARTHRQHARKARAHRQRTHKTERKRRGCKPITEKRRTPKSRVPDPVGEAPTSSGSATTTAPSGSTEPNQACSGSGHAVVLHRTPEATPGVEALSGGIYDVGGPAYQPGSCNGGVYGIGGTITVRDQSSHEVVAEDAIHDGEEFVIPLKHGAYEAESTECDTAGTVTFTVKEGETTRYDFICPIS